MSFTPPSGPALAADLLAFLDQLSGGVHPGFRPAHAKGPMDAETFTSDPAAAGLTRAPHANRPCTPVTARFSLSAAIPAVADNDPRRAGRQGMAVRFHLADHVHTAIDARSHNGFPVRTGEESLGFLRAAAVSGPDASTPADDPAGRNRSRRGRRSRPRSTAGPAGGEG